MKRIRVCFFRFMLLVCTAYVLSGCMLYKLKHDLREMDNLFFIGGEVTSESGGDNIVVAVIRYDGSLPALVDYQVLGKPGPFEFYLPSGKYKVFAYNDSNKNIHYDEEDPAVRTSLLSGEPGSVIDTIKLSIPSHSDDSIVREIDRLRQAAVLELPSYKKNLGKVVSLEFESFDRKNAEIGMWEPLRFVREVPFGIFFLEPYNRNKIPILFVHGINGTPQDFKEIVASLDRRRFQPWVAFYPSGLRLSTIVHFFDSELLELVSRYKLSKVYVVAHSMGGLVSRALILRDLKRGKSRLVSRFITLSTPWGGHAAAASGVKNAPVVMPVWNDMAPSSQFLKNLFASTISERVLYYLLFSYKGSSGVFQTGNNDGVVSILSELRLEAQGEAKCVRGFNANHTGILRDPDAIKMINSILTAK